MYYNLYTVYDIIADEASAPFMAKTDGVALRQYITAFRQSNKPDVNIEDYFLFRIASFDNETMKIKALDNPIKINITDVLAMETESKEEENVKR